MATRVAAALTLLVAFGIAWLAVSVPVAARLVQAGIVLSMAYVAWLAWNGWRAMRRVLAAGDEPGADVAPLQGHPFVSLILPARNEAISIGGTVEALRTLAYDGADGVGRLRAPRGRRWL